MNLHTLAYQRKEKFGKLKKQQLIRHLENMYEEAIESQKPLLADLYVHFLPALPKVAKTAFEWVAKACNKELTRPYLNYVYCDGENIVATDGHRLHMSKAPYGHGVGFYDHSGKKICGVDYTFPEYKKVIPTTNETSPYINLKTLENVLNISFISSIQKSKGENIFLNIGGKAGQVCLNKKMLEDALNGESEFVVSFKDWTEKEVKMLEDGAFDCYMEPILIENKFGTAVIMPRKEGMV